MRLGYAFAGPDHAACWVLRRGETRIELHLRQLDAGGVLICLGGTDSVLERRRSQGPFANLDAARAARRAVAAALGAEGFVLHEELERWSLEVQRLARSLRERPAVRAEFNESDVYLDW